MESKAIGMFDSGVGGVTVYKEVKEMFPNEKIIYVGDTKNFPYGSKSKDEIIECCRACADFLIQKNVKVIVIACGTATSQALEELQKLYDIPMIGIIQPTVSYLKEKKEKKYQNVGVIATKGTIRSNAWELHLKNQMKEMNVFNQACPLLAPMAEEGWTENDVARTAIKEYLKNFPHLDALILGCTHYPLFEGVMKEFLPETDLINTGKMVANDLKEKNIASNHSNEYREDEFYVTNLDSNFKEIASRILGKDTIQVKSV